MKKIFNAVHFVDVLILALVGVLVYGAIIFSVPREVSASGIEWVRYTVELGDYVFEGERRTVNAGFSENVAIGAPVFDALRGVHIGTVVDVYALPLQVQSFDETARVIRQADVAGLELTRIVIEAAADISDYEVLVGSVPVSVGRPAYIRSRDFAGAGYVVAMVIFN